MITIRQGDKEAFSIHSEASINNITFFFIIKDYYKSDKAVIEKVVGPDKHISDHETYFEITAEESKKTPPGDYKCEIRLIEGDVETNEPRSMWIEGSDENKWFDIKIIPYLKEF